MTTRTTIQDYFDALRRKDGWDAFLADHMTFASFAAPVKHLSGKCRYLESTKRFFSMISGLEVEDLIIDGDKACALTRYTLQPPGGPAFDSHVAEIFEVRDRKIVSLGIYFDSAPFPKPTAGA